EFRFTLSARSVAKGIVTFRVTNKGKTPHDFRIGGKKTALLAPGKAATLRVALKAGKAPYLCTLPGHAAAGMKGTLTVK
ncbi:MAG: plastocyanin/azurin family copper-binding protein, partial [Vicinamibacteria bacterium]